MSAGDTWAQHEKADPEQSSELLKLHIAEYQIIATRNTYWISLQYAVYTLMAVFLGLVVQAWGTPNSINHVALVWLSALILQFLVWAALETGCEQFSSVIYLERDLRIRIERIVNSHSFWGFEQYLNNTRKSGQDWLEWTWGVGILAGLVLTAALGAAAVFGYYNRAVYSLCHQFVWAALNVISAAVVAFKADRMRTLMKRLADVVTANHSRNSQG